MSLVCDRTYVTCRRATEAASEGWWSSGRSGCELRLCGGSWGPQSQGSALSGAQPAQEAARNMSLKWGWRRECPGREETGTESPEVTRWRGGNLEERAILTLMLHSLCNLLLIKYFFFAMFEVTSIKELTTKS